MANESNQPCPCPVEEVARAAGLLPPPGHEWAVEESSQHETSTSSSATVVEPEPEIAAYPKEAGKRAGDVNLETLVWLMEIPIILFLLRFISSVLRSRTQTTPGAFPSWEEDESLPAASKADPVFSAVLPSEEGEDTSDTSEGTAIPALEYAPSGLETVIPELRFRQPRQYTDRHGAEADRPQCVSGRERQLPGRQFDLSGARMPELA